MTRREKFPLYLGRNLHRKSIKDFNYSITQENHNRVEIFFECELDCLTLVCFTFSVIDVMKK